MQQGWWSSNSNSNKGNGNGDGNNMGNGNGNKAGRQKSLARPRVTRAMGSAMRVAGN